MKQVEFTIMGQGYILGCPDGGDALIEEAVRTVDREMSAIRDGGKVKARERIAVLAALNLAYRIAQPASAAQPAAPDGTPPPFDHAAEVDALVRRIDGALGSDGHLL